MPGEPAARPAGISDARVIRQVFPGEALAVRDALARTLEALPPWLTRPGPRGTVEIVLAEVLNNIVEHAYGGAAGQIELMLRPCPDGVEVMVADNGRPFPGGALPAGRILPPDPATGLPEGGFGWALIRTLALDLEYRRKGGRNQLTFRVPARQSDR